MTTYEYLNQVKTLNDRINNLVDEHDSLFTLATKVNVGEANPDRVQTTPDQDKTGTLIAKMCDLDVEINAMIDAYVDARDIIRNQIELLQPENDGKYYNLLCKKFLAFKDYDVIADEMNYTYRNIMYLKKDALDVFTERFGSTYKRFY